MAKLSDCQMGRHEWDGYKCTECRITAAKFEVSVNAFSLQDLITQMDGVFGGWTIYMSPGTYDLFRKLVFEKSEELLPSGGPAEFLGCEIIISNDIICRHGMVTYYMVPKKTT